MFGSGLGLVAASMMNESSRMAKGEGAMEKGRQSCPGCGKALSLPRSMWGKIVTLICPRCGIAVNVYVPAKPEQPRRVKESGEAMAKAQREYYVARKAKLLKGFDKTAGLVREGVASRYGEEFAEAIYKATRNGSAGITS